MIVRRETIQADSLLLLASLIWGVAFVAQQDAAKSLDALSIMAIRFLMGAAILAPLIIIRRARGVNASSPGALLWSSGLLLLAMPRALGARGLGLLLLAVVLLPRESPLAVGEFRITQFDVGQGLSVLIRTREHAVLYDSGPRWWGGGDAGETVVLPALRALGVTQLDELVIRAC